MWMIPTRRFPALNPGEDMQYSERSFGPVVLEAVDLTTLLREGPRNRTEAIVLGFYLAATAPTDELEERVLDSMDPLMRIAFPDAYQRFIGTPCGQNDCPCAWTPEEKEAFALLVRYAERLQSWVEAMEAGKVVVVPTEDFQC